MSSYKKLTIKELRDVQLHLLDQLSQMCAEHGLQLYLIGGTLLGAVRHGGFIPWDDDIDVALTREDFDYLCHVCGPEFGSPLKLERIQLREKYSTPITKLVDTRTAYYAKTDGEIGPDLDNGVFVDIFPLDYAPSSGWLRGAHQHISKFLIWFGNASVSNRKHEQWARRFIARLANLMLQNPRRLQQFRMLTDKFISMFSRRPSGWLCNYYGAYGAKESFPKAWLDPPKEVFFEGRLVFIFNEHDEYLKQIYGNYHQIPDVQEQEDSKHFHSVYWKC